MSEETTNIAGYFNPKTYTIAFQLSSPSLNVQVLPKRYLEVGGRRINDPILQGWVKKTGLAVEHSRTQVPIVRLHDPVPIGTGTGFGGTSKAPSVEEQMAAKRVPPSVMAPAEGTKVQAVRRPVTQLVSKEFVTGPSNPIQGMTMEQARKRGLVETTRTKDAEGVPDTEGGPPANPPPISYAMDSKLRRFLAGKHAQLEAGAAANGQAVPAAPEGASGPATEHTPIAEAELPIVDVAGLTAQIMTDMNKEASPVVATGAATPAEVAAAAPVVAATTPAPADAPPAGAAAPATVDPKKPFRCAVDGKTFQYRSYLVRHVKRNWPDRLEELLAPYPEK